MATDTGAGPEKSVAVSGQSEALQRLVQLSTEQVYHMPLDHIRLSGINSRVIDEENPDFHELVASLRTSGQLTPAIVGIEDNEFHLIAGERRYRALRNLGHPTIKVIVTDAPRDDWETIMLLENLQRQDLKAWEEARGYLRLVEKGWEQKQIAAKVGKSTGHVSSVLAIGRNEEICAALDERLIPSISFAREFQPLIDGEGVEVIQGVFVTRYDSLRTKTRR